MATVYVPRHLLGKTAPNGEEVADQTHVTILRYMADPFGCLQRAAL